MASKVASFKFYYDVVCPFAYMSSGLVESVAQRCGATVEWTPVLLGKPHPESFDPQDKNYSKGLGGLYEATEAAQSKSGSATDVMSPAKLRISGQDLHRQMVRRGTLYKEPLHNPQKTVTAMRLLSAIPDNKTRALVSHSLYKAYWYQQQDVTDLSVLQDAVSPFGLSASNLLDSPAASQVLRANTAEASQRGAFGVPSFYVAGKLYFGTDRLFFVERALGFDSHPERIVSPPGKGAANLTFFFDYASPWTFLGVERLQDMISSVAPVSVTIEWVPILLGGLFREIGTPMVPGAAMNATKREYYQKDLLDWASYAGVKIQFPDTFPLRTVLPLRVTLAAACDPQMITTIFRAAWQENKNIGEPKVLEEVLEAVPKDLSTSTLFNAASSSEIKAKLVANTKRAIDEGVCGVPSFQVNGAEVVWGQDKLNVVADMICGWKPAYQYPAKL